jgi:Probable cobalt transporter subunit (CbtA)
VHITVETKRYCWMIPKSAVIRLVRPGPHRLGAEIARAGDRSDGGLGSVAGFLASFASFLSCVPCLTYRCRANEDTKIMCGSWCVSTKRGSNCSELGDVAAVGLHVAAHPIRMLSLVTLTEDPLGYAGWVAVLDQAAVCGRIEVGGRVDHRQHQPSPVSVGGDETATRTGLYLLLVGLSLALIVGAVWLGRRLAARIGSWNAILVGAGAYGVGIAAAMWLLPPVDQTLKGFPADDVNALRLSSLATHLVLWAAIAAVFALLASRLITERTAPAGVLRLDDYRERLASPAQTQVRDSETHVPATHGRYQR